VAQRKICSPASPPTVFDGRNRALEKRGLRAPLEQRLRRKLSEFARESLPEARINKKGYFHPASVARLFGMHRSHKGDFGKYLMAVLVVQL